MAERLSLDLELVDKIGGPARAAAAALRKINDASEKAQGGLDKLGAAFAKVGVRAANAQAKDAQKFAGAWEKIGMKAETDRIRGESRIARARDRASAMTQKKTAAQYTKAVDDIKDGAKDAALIFGVASAALLLAGAYKMVSIFKTGVTEAFKEGSAYEQLKLSYRLTLGKKQGGEALSDIGRFSGQTGYDDDEIAKFMRPLFTSGMRGQGARSAFAAAGDLSAASGRPVEDFTELLAKIQLKGGISEKMLVGLGLDAKGFKGELGKTLGIGKDDAMQRAESGKADPQAILNALYSMIEKRQGGKLGTGTEEYGKTMGAKLHLMEQLPGNYLKAVADSDAWPRMTEQVSKILDNLDPNSPRGKEIIGSLTGTFEKLTGLAERALTPENIQGFTDALLVTVEMLGKIPVVFESLAEKAAKLVPVLDALGIATSSRSVMTESGEGRNKADELQNRLNAANLPYADVDDAVGSRATPFRVQPGGGSGRGGVAIGTQKIEVNVHPEKDDTAHTGRTVGKAIAKETKRSLEQGANEGGSG